MGERDAFGREQDEDSLAEMGWSTGGPPKPAPPAPGWQATTTPVPKPVMSAPPADTVVQPPPPPRPAPAAPQWQAPPPPSARPRGRRRTRFPFKLVFLLLIIGSVWAFNGPQWAKQKIDDLTNSVQNAARLPAQAPKGLEAGSLLNHTALTNALARLPDGKLTSLRVAPENISANLAQGSDLVVAGINSDGDLTVSTSKGGASAAQRGLTIDPAAPARMARTAARLAHEDVSNVSYLVALHDGERQVWLLYLLDGTHYRGDLHGRHVKAF